MLFLIFNDKRTFSYGIEHDIHHSSMKDNSPHVSHQKVKGDKLTVQACSRPEYSRRLVFPPLYSEKEETLSCKP